MTEHIALLEKERLEAERRNPRFATAKVACEEKIRLMLRSKK